ncbi:hypothetical protein [Actinomadura decatromicini]|uniref:Peptidase inhibitor family I36 protein n=1 Tax=Actinomadura decatromicini TaxID=2604572 RepID=A0A5D3FW21_9ACTN|nr:hypothetical protein [Actinomadura decatromicini]TYK52433.1 hypothetical protein FXF68_01210 [Actinomadura decatromicini]
MRSVKKVLIAAAASLTLGLGITGVLAQPASAATGTWKLCDDWNLWSITRDCLTGTNNNPPRVPDLRAWAYNDAISSIKTNSVAIEAWTNVNFQGTYGYFAPNSVWNALDYPYDNSISAISYPGA